MLVRDGIAGLGDFNFQCRPSEDTGFPLRYKIWECLANRRRKIKNQNEKCKIMEPLRGDYF